MRFCVPGSFSVCEGLIKDFWCGVYVALFSLVARKSIHLLARDLTYMVDL
jgi:hypothetical protein